MFLGQSEGLVDSTAIKNRMMHTYGYRCSKCFHHYTVVCIGLLNVLLASCGILKDIRFTVGVEHMYDLERFHHHRKHTPLINCFLTMGFFLQFLCQRWNFSQSFILFSRSYHGVFTTLTIEAGRTAVVNDRTFAIIALTLNRVKWEQKHCNKNSGKG